MCSWFVMPKGKYTNRLIQRCCGSMSWTSIRNVNQRPNPGAEKLMSWPGFIGPGGLAETKRASCHSSNRSGVVRTLQIFSGGADETAAGQEKDGTFLWLATGDLPDSENPYAPEWAWRGSYCT